MADYTKEEIAIVLSASEILNKKKSGEKINVSSFCQEAGISRKNAYKHKNTHAPQKQKEKLDELINEMEETAKKLEHAQKQANEADLNWQCRNILVELNADYKKNGPGKTPKRLKLIENYNRISSLLGLEPLCCWE
jgi:hypothetical protein